MTLFHEMYGAYFRAVERLLTHPSCTAEEMREAVRTEGFQDSVLFLPQKLLPDTPESWGFFKSDGAGGFRRITKNAPPQWMTTLQKRWLKAKLDDPKFQLFLSDDSLAALRERLREVEPLYTPEVFHYFDQFSNGDNFRDPTYRQHFRLLCDAAKTGEILRITYTTRNHHRTTAPFVILHMEYSHKNNKFRAYGCRLQGRLHKQTGLLNLSNIVHIEPTQRFLEQLPDRAACLRRRRCTTPVTVEVSPERNGIERFMMEFAAYEKRTEWENRHCVVQLWYDQQDETELLIQLLGFGPVVRILGPSHFQKKAAARVNAQYQLLGTQK